MSETTCTHRDLIQSVHPSADGCEECLQTGDEWVELRMCLICGHVGCCDSSLNRHATAHFYQTGHPVIESFHSAHNFRWCYVDEVYL